MISALEGRNFENANNMEDRIIKNMRVHASKLEGKFGSMMKVQIDR